MPRFALAAVALLAGLPAVVVAQSVPSVRADAKTSLDCAMWAAIKAGQSQDKTEVEALTVTMTWFLGRYEGLTGKRFDTSVSDDEITNIALRMDALNTTCLPLMDDIASRMTKWGDSKVGGPDGN